MPNLELYTGREQTYVKHVILEEYLSKFAHIIGWNWRTIAYVDCFSGPWESKDDENLSDTSFVIAVETLRKAKADLAQHGREPRVRCLFLEKDPKAYKRLKQYTESVTDIEVVPRNGTLETSVPEIEKFVADSGPDHFSFIFIDPTGWSGFALDVITPLLRLQHGEVLINFMTHHIRRFVDMEETADSFIKLFGSDVRDRLRGLGPQEREEALVGAYMRAIKERGNFSFIGAAIVLKPEVDTTHFHLVYATRHERGMEVFKKAEQDGMDASVEARARAKERKRLAESGQPSLFAAVDQYPATKVEELRTRYLAKARARIEQSLTKHVEVPYQKLWRLAVAFPLVWESDLREWLKDWRASKRVEYPGLTSKQRPTRERDDIVRWRG